MCSGDCDGDVNNVHMNKKSRLDENEYEKVLCDVSDVKMNVPLCGNTVLMESESDSLKDVEHFILSDEYTSNKVLSDNTSELRVDPMEVNSTGTEFDRNGFSVTPSGPSSLAATMTTDEINQLINKQSAS